MKKILIIVPTFNEQDSITAVITDLQAHGYKNIVVIDDGSTDNTYKLAKKMKVPVIKHIINRGLGAALGTGFEYAKIMGADIAVTFDSDGQHKAKEINKVLTDVKNNKADVVIFEDYDKGVINAQVIEEIVSQANRSGIPVAADPKKKNFIAYRNITLMKPNLKELREGLKTDIEQDNLSAIKIAAKKLQQSQQIGTVMITLSEKGIFISSGSTQKLIPAHIRNVSDVSGAGDTVISVAALCTALGLAPEITARLANLAGGQVCEKTGVVPVDLKQLMAEAKAENIF